MELGFAFEGEKRHFAKAVMAMEIESYLLERLSQHDYGSGVKNVAIGLIALDPEHSHALKVRKPVYKTGKWTSKTLPLEFEDTLEFDIKPPSSEIQSAENAAQLAEVIRRAIGFSLPGVLALEIPNFETRRFFGDLEKELKNFAVKRQGG